MNWIVSNLRGRKPLIASATTTCVVSAMNWFELERIASASDIVYKCCLEDIMVNHFLSADDNLKNSMQKLWFENKNETILLE